MSYPHNDIIYYNIEIDNLNSDTPIQAKFQKTRTDAILDRVGDYRCAVVRFTLPVSQLPIRHSQDILDDFSVSIGVGATNFTENVLSSNVDNGTDFILSYNDITKSINIAWKDTFDALKLALPGLISTEPPIITFFEASALFFVKIPLSYYTDNINIFCNNALWNYIQWSSKLVQPSAPGYVNDRQILYYDNGVNTDLTLGYTFFYQPYKTSSLFTDLKQIAFRTSKLPIHGELLGTQDDTTQTILTDFDPVQDAIGDSTRISFFPRGPLRYYELYGNDLLRSFDVDVVYNTSTSNQVYNLVIAKGEFVNIKLMFRSKNLNL
jgi:hypothetical protein